MLNCVGLMPVEQIEETLQTTKASLMQAETEILGGAHMRFHPHVSLQQMAGLMQRAGFALPVVDFETIQVSYADILNGLRDIRQMGESLALHGHKPSPLRRDILNRAQELHNKDSDNRILLRFDLIYAIGWAPDASQPQPKQRGSATTSLADALS